MLVYLSSPYWQLVFCCLLIFLLSVFSKLDVGKTLMSGMWIGMFFLPSSLFYGVFFDQTWLYLFHLFIAAVVFSVFWVLMSVIAGKLGKGISNGEGWMVLMMPLTVYPIMFVFALLIKLVFDFIR